MKFIGLIPARGGSKRLKKKNILNFAGKPLIEWTAIEAKKSNLDEIIVSTDDKKIGKLAKNIGLKVPFLRPKSISKDNTPMIKVISHFLEWLDLKKYSPLAIVILQPTSPLRKYFHINNSIKLFKKNNTDSVVSVSEIPINYKIGKFMIKNNKGFIKNYKKKRNDLVVRNGPSIIVTKISNIRKKSLYGKRVLAYNMDIRYSIDINDEYDFKIAEFIHLNL